MKNQNFQEWIKELQDVEVQLPLHQKALRERLLTMHDATKASRSHPFHAVHTRLKPLVVPLSSKRFLSVGVVTVGLLVMGWLLLHAGSSKAPPQKQIVQTIRESSPATPVALVATTAQGHSEGSGNYSSGASSCDRQTAATIMIANSEGTLAYTDQQTAVPETNSIDVEENVITATIQITTTPLSLGVTLQVPNQDKKDEKDAIKEQRKENKNVLNGLKKGLNLE